jgi:hypothetical protein
METIIMVKVDKSCATKTGHFYLSPTDFQEPISFDNTPPSCYCLSHENWGDS